MPTPTGSLAPKERGDEVQGPVTERLSDESSSPRNGDRRSRRASFHSNVSATKVSSDLERTVSDTLGKFQPSPPSEAGDTASVAGSSIWGTEHTPTKKYSISLGGSNLNLSETAPDADQARESWLFVPKDRWVQVWAQCIHAMVIVSGFFAPLRYALLDPQDVGALVLDSVLDVIFAIDILFTFNLSIWTPSGYLISRLHIAKRYWWSGRLFLDILATAPVDLIGELAGLPPSVTSALALLRLVRLYRLLVMFREMQQSDKTNLIVIMLAKFVTCILLSTHLSACLFWGLARDDSFGETTWVGQGAPLLPSRQWAARYVTSLFWAVGTFKAGPASGDLVPTSDSEKILACVVMMANICLQTYLVSNLSALLTRADVGIYTMRKELRQLSVFSKTFGLPKHVKEQLQSYVRFKFSTDQELESSVMSMLPELYRQRISSLLYSKLVREVELFSGCAKRFLSQLHGSLTSNLYMAGHHLVYVDESTAYLYIISEGEVMLSSQGVSVETRRSLETFSEFAFLCRLPEPFDVSSKTLCRILALNVSAWESAIATFPADGVQVMENLIRISKRRRFEFPKNTVGSRIYKSIIRDAQTHIIHRRDMTTAALCFAAASGDVAEVKKLVTGQSPNCCDYDRRTPLHVAAAKGQVEVIKILLDAKAQINSMDNFSRTPLMEACRQRQMGAARALHDAGAQLGFGEDMSLKVRHSLTSESDDSGQDERSEEDSNAPQEVFDKFAEAAELCAAAADPQQLWFLTSLLKFRADANAGDYDRRTPLHLACASGNHGAVEVLLQEDVINMDCRDNFGRTPLMEAVRHGNESCARKLMHRGAHHGFCVDGETDDANATHAGQELCQAAFSGQNKYLNNLISLCGLSPDCCDYDKRTALMLACAEGNMDAAVTLVQVHADPYLKDRWGHTALMEAKDNGHYDLVEVMERIWKSHQKRKKQEKDTLFPV